ncbi:alpha/beta hydrolase [Rhodococcus sp. NPDC058521]|uniref:alpha/beta hydrolase n=1 Tax=Rhodococcus sp. NPDC058521 TaxID=3346536 RepID=UPI00364860A7
MPDTLVISVTGNPVTPYKGGESLADALGGTVLTVEGERHTVAQEGISPCVNDIVEAYLTEVSIPTGELTCRL